MLFLLNSNKIVQKLVSGYQVEDVSPTHFT